MKKQDVITFFSTLKALNPNPVTELEYQSSFELLIAVMLSAQATDISVNKATRVLFKAANTPETMLALGENLKDYIKTIGLYNSKAINILKTCQMLIEQHQSQVPETLEALIKLPGVGRKTASVVLNTAFGQPTIAVDTHIFRVANRTTLAKGKTADQVADKLLRVVPKEFVQDAHHWLILHGRYICKARKPDCHACPVFEVCGFKEKELIKQTFHATHK